jgi:hypothetical protein
MHIGGANRVSFVTNSACDILVDIVGYYVPAAVVSKLQTDQMSSNSSSVSGSVSQKRHHVPTWTVYVFVISGLVVAAIVIAFAAILFHRHRQARRQQIQAYLLSMPAVSVDA